MPREVPERMKAQAEGLAEKVAGEVEETVGRTRGRRAPHLQESPSVARAVEQQLATHFASGDLR